MTSSPPEPARPLSSEVHTAARNALKLGLSLIATWGVALVVRLLLPRYLGPDRFGMYTFAENFAAMSLGFLSFGVDTYIQKEIPLRPQHASDFFGGAALLRSALAVFVLLGMQAVLSAAGRPPEAHHLVLAFGIGYAIVNLSNSFASMLQANTTVSGLAAVNVIGKLAWGGLVIVGLVWRLPVEALGAAFVLAEVVRATCLHLLARRHLGLRMRVDIPAAFGVIRASLPFYANSLAIALGSRMDVTVLGFLTHDDHEVGWYGAASNLAGLAFLLSPLMSSVLLPLLSRAHARSAEAFWRILHRAAEALFVVGTPVVLVLTLDAELWVKLAFGPAFLPAAVSLRALAPQFVLTYLAVLYSMALMVKGDGWALTSISVAGVIVNPLLAAILVPRTWALGPGGAGVGSGLALIAGELFVAVLLLRRLGRPAFDARLVRVAVATLGAAAGAAVTHELLLPLGPWRLLPDLAVYATLALAMGALRPRDLLSLAREIGAARRPVAAP